MASPEISILIVSFNSEPVIAGCLRSLRRVRDEADFEVVVMDNASTDGTAELVARDFPECKLIRMPHNAGFGGGMNQGFQEGKGNYFLCLNPDTIVPRETLSKLLGLLKKNGRVGIVGAALTDMDGQPQDSTFRFPSLPREFLNYLPELKAVLRLRQVSEAIGQLLGVKSIKYKEPHTVECIGGAAFLVRSEVVRQLGGFDEGFFVYHEERDFCRRAINAGWEVWTVPRAQVIHLDAQSTGYRKQRLPRMPVLGWRVAGMDRLWWKHRSRFMHTCWRRQTRCLLRLRVLTLWFALPFVGNRKSAVKSRVQELRRAISILRAKPVSECELTE